MKKLLKTTFILSFLILFTSCEKKCEKKVDEAAFEKKVLTEIFPKIVDSICVDSRKMDPPPKFGIETWSKGNIIKVDTSKATNKQTNKQTKKERIKYNNWRKEQNRIDKDTSEIIIGFDNYLLNYGENRVNIESKLLNYGKNIVNIESKLLHCSLSNFNFDYSKIKLNNKFKIKNITEFPKAEKLTLAQKKNFII